MKKELMERLDKINLKKEEVISLAEEGKLDEAEAAKAELEKLQKQFDILKDVEDMKEETVKMNIEKADVDGMIEVSKPADAVHEFAEAARKGFKTNADIGYPNETNGNEGGYTVPEDIQTKIQHFKEAEYSLRQLVSVENVKTNKGARTYQTKTQAPGFAKVAENGALQGISAPKYTRITYDIEDYGGYLPVTNDLLSDSDANIANEIITWIGRNSLATDNNEILAILKGKDATAFTNLAGIKKAINVTLGQAYRPAVKIVTNDDGLNYLDTLNDEMGRPLLNPNPTEPNKIQLRVGATVVPIEIIPNTVLASEGSYSATSDVAIDTSKTYYTRTGSGTDESPYVYTPVDSPDVSDIATYYEMTASMMPFIIGDFKEAVRIYDRQKTTILASDVASVTGFNAFEQRGRLFRADVRADYKEIDSDSWVNGYISVLLGE